MKLQIEVAKLRYVATSHRNQAASLLASRRKFTGRIAFLKSESESESEVFYLVRGPGDPN